MPLHEHEPVSEAEAKLKLRVATAMAKSMSNKLVEKSGDKAWHVRSQMWDQNPEYWKQGTGHYRKPIDVLMITYDDFANTMYRFWLCAKNLGLNAVAIKGKSHMLQYPVQAPLHPSLMNGQYNAPPTTILAPGLEHMLNSAHIVHLFATTFPVCNFDWNSTFTVVQHGGTVYRQSPYEVNAHFNQIARKAVIQCPDLLGLGAKNETLIYYPVDTEFIQPDFTRKKPGRLVVGHFPSNPFVKGSDQVIEVIKEVAEETGKVDFIAADDVELYGRDYRSNRHWKLVTWEKNLERMKKCDVIIETLASDQDGKPYGEWGNTALEAAASGCIVISNCVHRNVYEREYGDLGVHVANDRISLKEELIRLTCIDGLALEHEKRLCRQWAEEKHSISVTAKRLWNKVYSRFF